MKTCLFSQVDLKKKRIKNCFFFGCAVFLLLCGLFCSRGAWASHCHGFLCCGAWALGIPGFCSCGVRAQQLQLPGSGATSSIAVSHGLCCSTVCGILPDQGLNPCPLHWQADNLSTVPLGKSGIYLFFFKIVLQE